MRTNEFIGWTARSVGFLLALGVLATEAVAAKKAPAAVEAILPAEAKLMSGSWDVLPTEFGKSYGANLHAGIPGKPSSCDITIGPEIRVSLKGDTAWESPPMLDMAIQLHDDQIKTTRASLQASVANMAKPNAAAGPVGKLQEETTKGGRLLLVEYQESCSRHQGPNTVVRGFGRKGAMTVELHIWISAGTAEAKAMAEGMLNRFQRLDAAELTR